MAAVGELAVHGSPGDFVEDFVQPSIVPDLDLSQTRCIYDHAVFGHEQLSADCCVTVSYTHLTLPTIYSV